MQTSQKGKDFITTQEGNVLRAYKDTGGVWTIGRGITTAAGLGVIKAGMTITAQESDRLFDQALPKYEARVLKAFEGKHITQELMDAAVDFDWNTGKIHEASWVTYYKMGNFVESERRLKLWNKDNGRVLSHLVKRRALEADIIFRNKYPSNIEAPELPMTQSSAQRIMSTEEIKAAQAHLVKLGFLPETPQSVDGIMGPMTRKAIQLYQQSHPNLTADGILGPATLSQIMRDISLLPNLLSKSALAAIPTAAGASLPIVASEEVSKWSGQIALYGVIITVAVVVYILAKNWDIVQRKLNTNLSGA